MQRREQEDKLIQVGFCLLNLDENVNAEFGTVLLQSEQNWPLEIQPRFRILTGNLFPSDNFF